MYNKPVVAKFHLLITAKCMHCLSGGSRIETYYSKIVFYCVLCSTISVFVIIQYNLMVGAYFSLIGYDPKFSHLLARIAIPIADVMKGL